MSTPERDDEAVPEPPAPKRRQSDVDAAWAEIVSHWEGRVPSADDADPGTDPAPGAAAGAATRPEAGGPGGAGAEDHPGPGDDGPAPARPVPALTGPRDHVLPEADDAGGSFVPEVAPPLSRLGWAAWLPWAGVLGGPLLLVLAAVVYRSVPGAVVALAVAAFTAGAVLLVLRLPTRRSDDGDDGAVV